MEKSITYFEKSGEENTNKVISLVKDRLKDSDIKLSTSGTYIKDDISTSLQNIDALLTTQFIE